MFWICYKSLFLLLTLICWLKYFICYLRLNLSSQPNQFFNAKFIILRAAISKYIDNWYLIHFRSWAPNNCGPKVWLCVREWHFIIQTASLNQSWTERPAWKCSARLDLWLHVYFHFRLTTSTVKGTGKRHATTTERSECFPEIYFHKRLLNLANNEDL